MHCTTQLCIFIKIRTWRNNICTSDFVLPCTTQESVVSFPFPTPWNKIHFKKIKLSSPETILKLDREKKEKNCTTFHRRHYQRSNVHDGGVRSSERSEAWSKLDRSNGMKFEEESDGMWRRLISLLLLYSIVSPRCFLLVPSLLARNPARFDLLFDSGAGACPESVGATRINRLRDEFILWSIRGRPWKTLNTLYEYHVET